MHQALLVLKEYYVRLDQFGTERHYSYGGQGLG